MPFIHSFSVALCIYVPFSSFSLTLYQVILFHSNDCGSLLDASHASIILQIQSALHHVLKCGACQNNYTWKKTVHCKHPSQVLRDIIRDQSQHWILMRFRKEEWEMALHISTMVGSRTTTQIALPKDSHSKHMEHDHSLYRNIFLCHFTFFYNSLKAGTLSAYLSLYPYIPGT